MMAKPMKTLELHNPMIKFLTVIILMELRHDPRMCEISFRSHRETIFSIDADTFG